VENDTREVRLISVDNKSLNSLIPPFRQEAFVISVAWSPQEKLWGITSSDKIIYFFDGVGQRKLDRSVLSSTIQTGIWWLPTHLCWVTAGTDFVLRQWNISTDLTEELMYKGHEATIMDVVEIKIPKCVASCSLDRMISLWSFDDKEHLIKLSKHTTGVRCLD